MERVSYHVLAFAATYSCCGWGNCGGGSWLDLCLEKSMMAWLGA
jgi:hypothetical protein